MNDRQTELKEHSAHTGMTLTKGFVNHCRNVGLLRNFLCQAMDQVDAKNKEIAEIKQQYNDMDIAHTVHIAKMNAKIEEMEANERRLKRALYSACENWADAEVFSQVKSVNDDNTEANKWAIMRDKCRSMTDKWR